MSDAYENLRNLPLKAVISALTGQTEWRERKNGAEFYGVCPVCRPKKNKGNFSFTTAGVFRCFSCPAKGRGSLDLVMQIEKLGFRDAVERLKSLNIEPESSDNQPAGDCQQIVNLTENQPFKSTYEKFKVESAWLKDRGLLPATLERFGVFEYRNPKRTSAYNGSVMLRISRYSDGECVAYLSRNLGDITPEKPKYRFPAGFAKGLELFGAWNLKNAHEGALPIRRVFLVESPFCVMKFAQLGFEAVSPFGWTVSPEQAAILSHLARGVTYLPDTNKREEALRAIGPLSASCWVKTPDMPNGITDPESLSYEQIVSLT